MGLAEQVNVMRTCAACGVRRPAEEFLREYRSRRHYVARCKACIQDGRPIAKKTAVNRNERTE